MIAFHYMIVFSQLYLMAFYLLDFEKRKMTWPVNLLVIMGLLAFDVFRYGQFGMLIHQGDMVIYYGWALTIMTYAMQEIKRLPGLIMLRLSVSLVGMMIASVVFTTFSIPISTLLLDPIKRLIGASLGFILLFFLYYVKKKKGLTLNRWLLTKKDVWMMVVSVLFFGFSMSTILFLANYLSGTTFGIFLNIFAILGVMIAIYVSLAVIAKSHHLKNVENRNRLQNLNLQRQKQHYATLKMQHEEVQKFRHDIRKQLRVLYRMLMQENYEKACERVQGLMGTYKEIEELAGIKTGSDVIDANLYFLQREGRYADVQVEWEGWFENRVKMDDDDIIVLFVNLIENAFEAASKVLKDAYVKIMIEENDKDTYIKVQNNYNGIMDFRNGTYKTIKPHPKGHGLGLTIVEEVVLGVLWRS